MTIAQLTGAMIARSEGNLHDINHFLKVWAYTRTIGQCEGLDDETQAILEAAALLHDIACPLCREKYGNTNGKYQEAEGQALAADFLRECGYPQPFIDRVAYLVGHHHTPDGVDGPDYQILLEADYLVNAAHNHHGAQAVAAAKESFFRTETGIRFLERCLPG